VGQDGELHILPMEPEEAQEALNTLLSVWRLGQQAPLPLPFKTALALAQSESQEGEGRSDSKAEVAYEGGGDAMSEQLSEVREMCLARVFPDFESLCEAKAENGQGLHEMSALVYGPMLRWVDDCVTAYPHAPL
jgi:exodeoxyribonuclease V gamma subunit